MNREPVPEGALPIAPMPNIASPPTTRTVPAAKSRPNSVAPRPDTENHLHPLVNEATSKDVLVLLLGLRFLNAIAVATFFQPDEYFQALEPAWRLAFGARSGAWITWVRLLSFRLLRISTDNFRNGRISYALRYTLCYLLPSTSFLTNPWNFFNSSHSSELW